MADFISPGWGIYIAIVSLVSILACLALAVSLATRRAPGSEGDEVETTGHVWDEDLSELNNPLPRWWLKLFYAGVFFALAYLALYPGLGSYQGLLGWSSKSNYNQEMEAAREVTDPLFAEYLALSVDDVAKDPEAVDMGERLFLTYCTQCHGSDARGSRSFPNLADNDWLGAGDGEYVKTTITNGRTAMMPSMAAAVGSDVDVDNVVQYVLSLSDSNHDAAMAEQGKAKFAVCAACHGPEGKGNPAVGAPNLVDDTWLYGGSAGSIRAAIQKGKQNQMPAFGELLGEGKIHVLAAYVKSLSAGATE